ncbi:MAG: UPF0280 family protein [Bacillota bacterium]|nr:UPF0280 family protein [Bacillota bacterium]
MQEERFYRAGYGGDLESYRLTIGETDLAICVPEGVWHEHSGKKTADYITNQRRLLQEYIVRHPEFASSHTPLPVDKGAPAVARIMMVAANKAGVGPMAAVAGTFALLAGRLLSYYSDNVIVENGGDIYLKSSRPRTVGVYAGDSPFSGLVGVVVPAGKTPCGVCTSSGTVGSSFSYGVADAALIFAADAPLADAVATAAANLVHQPGDVEAAADYALGIEGVYGAVVICKDKLAIAGELELVKTA